MLQFLSAAVCLLIQLRCSSQRHKQIILSRSMETADEAKRTPTISKILFKQNFNMEKCLQFGSRNQRSLCKFRTRTHSMACHRKSPRSRKNIMVIDPLTPSQVHQFDRRLKIFSVSWSPALPL